MNKETHTKADELRKEIELMEKHVNDVSRMLDSSKEKHIMINDQMNCYSSPVWLASELFSVDDVINLYLSKAEKHLKKIKKEYENL